MKILTGAGVEKLNASAKGVNATIKGKDGKVDDREFSHVIVAIGIVPNTENIGLEALGVKTDRGHIVTDGYGRTNVEGIYAIGDVTGPPWLAHKASHEGVVCVEAIAGQKPHPHARPGTSRAAPIRGRRSPASASPKPRRRKPATRSRSANSPSSATARRSRWARPRAS